MMSNLGSHSFGIKFESDDSASSMMSGNSVQGDPSQYDAAEAAVAKLGSLMDGQRGKFSCAGIRAIASGLMGALNCLLFPRLTNSPPPPLLPPSFALSAWLFVAFRGLRRLLPEENTGRPTFGWDGGHVQQEEETFNS